MGQDSSSASSGGGGGLGTLVPIGQIDYGSPGPGAGQAPIAPAGSGYGVGQLTGTGYSVH